MGDNNSMLFVGLLILALVVIGSLYYYGYLSPLMKETDTAVVIPPGDNIEKTPNLTSTTPVDEWDFWATLGGGNF